MVRAIPSKVSPRFLYGGGTSGPPPLSTTNAMLVKTPYSYLSRDGADVSGINYQQSWSVEVAVDLPDGGYSGYFNDIVRHSAYDAAVGLNGRPGWSLHTGSDGYGRAGGWNLYFTFNDGGSPASYVGWTAPNAYAGKLHIVITFDYPTKTMDFFVNGTNSHYGYGTKTNPSMAPPVSITHPLTIGSYHRDVCGTDANLYSFGVSKIALSEFNVYLMRIWQTGLSSTDVSSLYNHWGSGGKTSIPGAVAASPITAIYFHEQVGNKSGGAGTGWVKDSVGGNHLKIVSTNAYTGVTGPISTTVVPAGGLGIQSPSNGATSVTGATEVSAGGLWGTSNFMNYYIEADEVNTFDSPNLRNSGWLLADGMWKPGFKPSTTYYLRCKARNGDSLASESGWSSVSSFTTRAVQEWYVRSLSGTSYGTGSGLNRTDALNGFRHNGGQGGRSAPLLQQECDLRKIAPGDTVWMLGDNWGILESSSITESSTQPRYQAIVGNGLPTHPIRIRMDDATEPGKVHLFTRFTGSYAWASEGSGIYSTATHRGAHQRIAFDNGSGRPELGTELQDTMYYVNPAGPLTGAGAYVDTAGTNRLYVRLPDNSNPANKIWWYGGYGDISVSQAQHVNFEGGDWFATSPQTSTGNPGRNGKFISILNCNFKYHVATYGIHAANGCDDWLVDGCKFRFMQNGIYGANSGGNPGTDLCGNRWTIRNNWFHHMGVATSGNWVEGDSHCIGWQAGEYWTVEDNLCEYSGSAINQWGFEYKWCRGSKIRRNIIRECTKRSVTHGAAIVIDGGTVWVGRRVDCEILHNVVFNADGSGIHSSTGDPMPVQYNLIMNTGLIAESPGADDFQWQSFYSGSCSASRPWNITMTGNVFVNPYHRASGSTGRFIRAGGDGTGTIVINNNLYWDTAPVDDNTASKFSAPGIGGGSAYSFNAWKATAQAPDANSYFENPLTSAHVPTGFDDLMIKGFCRSVLCDFDGDGSVTAADLTYFDNYAAGNGARVAARKLLQNILTYGAY